VARSIGGTKGGTVTPSAWALDKAEIMMFSPLPRNILLAPFTPILKASQTVRSPLLSTYHLKWYEVRMVLRF